MDVADEYLPFALSILKSQSNAAVLGDAMADRIFRELPGVPEGTLFEDRTEL